MAFYIIDGRLVELDSIPAYLQNRAIPLTAEEASIIKEGQGYYDTSLRKVVEYPGQSALEKAKAQKLQELEQWYNQQIDAGYDTGKGFSLKLHKEDRDAFAQLLLLVREGLDLGTLSINSTLEVLDTINAVQILTVQEFRQMMVGYGLYYKQLWNQYVAKRKEIENAQTVEEVNRISIS